MSENKVFLAAIDRYTETTTVSNTEKKINGKDFIN